MTIGNMRSLGVRDLEAYFGDIGCNHAGPVSGERFPGALTPPTKATRFSSDKALTDSNEPENMEVRDFPYASKSHINLSQRA